MSKQTNSLKKYLKLSALFIVISFGCSVVWAAEAESYASFIDSGQAALFTVNNLWILIAAALVFVMHLGFATLEAGLTQSKNTVNILFKNTFVICIGLLSYAVIGFNTMYPGDFNGILSIGGPIASYFGPADEVANLTASYGDYTYWSDFIFQAMFAATAATIVSGAVAERIKLSSFIVFSTVLVAIAYPIAGAWKWGGGWLDSLGFYDFAGSSIVHAFGGFTALACVIVLGPRAGKYLKNGRIRPIPGHNFPLATMGVFLLFLGWFGFNGGSVLNADPATVSFVFVTTALAAAAGGIGSITISWYILRKPDLSMALNGVLAGLVGITAGADKITVFPAILVGLIAGIIVVLSIILFDRIKIDDPVGAISVHGVCGIWGTLAVGIWGDASFGIQLLGTLTYAIFAFAFAFLLFSLLKVLMGVRVSEDNELEGLDISEHGETAYPEFKTNA